MTPGSDKSLVDPGKKEKSQEIKSKTTHKDKLENISPKKAKEMVAKLLAPIPKDKRIAFVEFTDSTGEVTKFSQSIYLQLEPIVITEGNRLGLSFIERKDLKFIMDEWDLKSLYHNEMDLGAQTLLGADFILTGKTLAALNDTLCTLKLVDLSNGKIIMSISEKINTVKKEIKPADLASAPPVPAKEKKRENLAVSDDSMLSIWSSKQAYNIGDTIEIFFSVKQPLYVEIIDITPEGEITKLFPNDMQRNNFCTPDKVYRIPPENGDTELLVSPPKGIDRIKAIASTAPIGDEIVSAKTRGIQFTKKIVSSSNTRANLSIVIQ